MRGKDTNKKGILRRITELVAYYPVTLFFGISLLAVAVFLLWLKVDLHWVFNWFQLKRWLGNHLVEIVSLFSALLGIVLIGSAIAYKQVTDLTTKDYNLWLHHKATRVLFPIFTPLHDWIRIRSRIYHWWHSQVYSHFVHYALLVIAIIGLGQISLTYVSPVSADHGCSDTVSITGATTWSTNQCHGDVTISNGATLTINGGITADLTSLTLGNGVTNGFITAKGDTLNNLGVVLNVDGNVDVKTGSSISANGQGYDGGSGPGHGQNTAGAGGGGGYGGNGGHSGPATPVGVGGIAYDSVSSPDQLGSGGGSGTAGKGGGAIKINSQGTVTVNGSITSNGLTNTGNAGGGSGGAIWVVADTIAGGGTVTANGANGGTLSPGGGGGGGGRIVFDYTTNNSSLAPTAFGGNTTFSTARKGGAGTIEFGDALTIANNSSFSLYFSGTYYGTTTPLTESSYIYSSTTIKDRADVTVESSVDTLTMGTSQLTNQSKLQVSGTTTTITGGTLAINTDTNVWDINKDISPEPTFGDVTIGTGTLNHTAQPTAETYHIIIASTGNVDVSGSVTLDGRGFGGGNGGTVGFGPGAGNGGTGGTACGGGGAYGGNGQGATGVCGGGGATGGTAYGTIASPDSFGSGGGGGNAGAGGAGGGAIKINAPSGTVTVTGTVSANGNIGTGSPSGSGGGGSGGAIWIIGNGLSGNGTIRANGGGACTNACTGGSGGRVVIDVPSDGSTATTQSRGGEAVTTYAAAGTLLKVNQLIISNNTTGSNLSPVTPIDDTGSYSALTISNRVHVQIADAINIDSGDATLENNSKLELMGNSTVLSGEDFITQTGTNIINIPSGITSRPSFETITISGTLTHDLNGVSDQYSINFYSTGDITINGTINVDSKGGSGGGSQQNGSGTGAGSGSATAHGGGGGYGSAGGSAGGASGAGGSTYGSAVHPVDMGSGGGGGNGTAGGAGGGIVRLYSNGTLAVNSSITAIGGNGANSTNDGGGGSGGSIMLVADTITGSGAITSSGGNGNSGGCGGGGRVARHYNSSTYSGTVSVAAGSGAGTCVVGTNTIISTVTNFLVTGHASPITAGNDGSVTVTARDAANNTNLAYNREVTFTSSDGQADLPSNYTFIFTDEGVKTFTNQITLKTSGSQSITVTEVGSPAVAGSQSGITVNHATPSAMTFSGFPSTVTAGSSNSITATIKDAFDNTASGYTGTIQFTSSDTTATLPTNYTFTGGDAGAKVFSGVVLKKAGSQSITATDTVTSSITATQSGITVNPGSASLLTFTTAPDSVGAGQVSSVFTVKRFDQFENTVTSGSTAVGLSSNSTGSAKKFSVTPTGSVVSSVSITNGQSQANFYYYDELNGTWTITASSSGLTSATKQLSVGAGAASAFELSGVTSPLIVGGSTDLTIEVKDSFGNTITDYTGTVKIASSDAKATYAANYTFTDADNGKKTISDAVTFATAGTHSISVVDTLIDSISGTISGIVVNPDPNAPTDPPTDPSDPPTDPADPPVPPSTLPTVELNGTVPATGKPIFNGQINQEVDNKQLSLTVEGQLNGKKLIANAVGLYGATAMKGTAVATVEGNTIQTGNLLLFNDDTVATSVADTIFQAYLKGTVTYQRSQGGGGTHPNSSCVIDGQISFEVNGRVFKGEGRFTINRDGQISGNVSGTSGNRRAFGQLEPTDVNARVIAGEITQLRQSNNKLGVIAKAIGKVRDGDLVIKSIRNCTITPEIEFEGPGITGGGTTTITTPGTEVPGETEITGVVNGTAEETENPEEQVLVNGIIVTEVQDIVIGLQSGEYSVVELLDVVSGLSTIIGLLAALILLPVIQAELLTSTSRGVSFYSWILGILPWNQRRRKKRWGTVEDSFTGVPIAGLQVRLVDLKTRETVKSMRTDRTGGYGFIVDNPGKYYVAISDPLYETFASEVLNVDNTENIISRNISLDPIPARRRLFSQKVLRLLYLFQVLYLLHWPLLIIGTFFAVWLVLDQTTLVRSIVIGVYGAIWLMKLLNLSVRRRYGIVKSADGTPLANAVVQLTKDNVSGVEAHIYSSVTDKKGRFLLIAQPANYELTVSKEGFEPLNMKIGGDSANIKVELNNA